MSEPGRLGGQSRLLEAILTVSSDLDLAAMLKRIVEAAVELVDARYGALGVLDETGRRLAEFVTVGIDDETYRAIGPVPSGHGILGLLIKDARPLRLPDLRAHPDSYGFPPAHPPMKSFLGVPLLVRDRVFGNLYLTDKTTDSMFTEVDENLVVGLASAAGVAIENARLHRRLEELAIVEDRERIARDLHDTVIQRLFATGMSLQGTTRLVHADPAAAVDRIDAAIDDLDVTVKHIRTVIFDLESNQARPDGLRNRVLTLVDEWADNRGFEPSVLLDGPLDSALDDDLGNDLIATLTEALSNVARHARATEVYVEAAVEGAADSRVLRLEVIDDGVGVDLDHDPRGHGIRNMQARAEDRGGSFHLAPHSPHGTRLEWKVPCV